MAKKTQRHKPYILVLDPAVQRPEISSLQLIASMTPLDVAYHLPAMANFGLLNNLKANDPLLKGIIVLGSLANMDERLAWKTAFVKWIDKFLEVTPVFGICFGHQMIASMYGAKVNYAFHDKTKHSGFRKVDLQPDELWGNKKKSGHLVVSHCQIVRNCPKDLKLTASSPEVEVEGLRHKSKPLWTLQPHPEAFYDFVEQRGIPAPASAREFKLGHQLLKSFLKYCE